MDQGNKSQVKKISINLSGIFKPLWLFVGFGLGCLVHLQVNVNREKEVVYVRQKSYPSKTQSVTLVGWDWNKFVMPWKSQEKSLENIGELYWKN